MEEFYKGKKVKVFFNDGQSIKVKEGKIDLINDTFTFINKGNGQIEALPNDKIVRMEVSE